MVLAGFALVGLLTSCSAGGDSEEPAGEPDLAEVFGSAVGPREDGRFGLDRYTVVPAEDGEPRPPGAAVRVSYPAGSVSPSASRKHGVPEGGMQLFLPLEDERLDEAFLRYWVRFPGDFEFVKGGKLPGLWGGSEVSGGEEPDGTNGFSTRLMWRRDGAGEVYLYAPDESGTSLGRGEWTWPTDRWVCVEQRVVLNDPDDDDGSVTVWLDGQEVFSESGMRYRTVDELKVEGIFFSTFYGGADPSWAPSRDQHVDFAAFEVSKERVGCEPA